MSRSDSSKSDRNATADSITEEAIRLHAAGMSFAQIAGHLGVSKDSIQKRVQKAVRNLAAPASLPPELFINANSVLILNDLHANYVDWRVVESALEFARNSNIRHCAIVGDLLNGDSIGRHPSTFGRAEGLQKEFLQAREVLGFLAKQIRSIYWCRGNHDYRVSVSTNGEFDMLELSRILHPGDKGLNIHVTPYDRMWISAKTGLWMLVHPHQYSQNPLVIARRLSLMHQCHVLVAHQHHHALGASTDGKFVVADLPCACLEMPYKAMNTNSMPKWSSGYAALVNGRLVMRSPSLPYSV